MSAFMLSPRTIAILAESITTVYNCSYNVARFGFSEMDTKDALLFACKVHGQAPTLNDVNFIHACDLYRAMYAMNARAINERYEDADQETDAPDKPEVKGMIRTLEYDGHSIIPDDYYQLIKWTDCYLYQCSEGEVPKEPLFAAIQDFQRNLQSMIV